MTTPHDLSTPGSGGSTANAAGGPVRDPATGRAGDDQAGRLRALIRPAGVGTPPSPRTAWERRQRGYWNSLAGRYDDLYRDWWSRAEDRRVAARLSFLRGMGAPVVLDLGCGTGLGHRLVAGVNPRCRYLGVDISPAMARIAHHGGVSAVVASMDRLGFVRNGSVDVVVSFSASFSLAYDAAGALGEIRRILRPGGHAYLSVLGHRSLSRVAGFNRGATYTTRHDSSGPGHLPVRRWTRAGMLRLATASGLHPVRVAGVNALSGVLEFPPAWPVGGLLARLVPDLAHTLEFHLHKGK